jgi:hypothetical protein
MPWEEVKAHLVVGNTYNLTSCYSGILVHVLCTYVGTYARFQPVEDWDNATLRGSSRRKAARRNSP